MLRLHASAHCEIYRIGEAVKDLGSIHELITSNTNGNDGEDAGYLLEANHAENDAVVTFCCLNIEFILKQESGRCH